MYNNAISPFDINFIIGTCDVCVEMFALSMLWMVFNQNTLVLISSAVVCRVVARLLKYVYGHVALARNKLAVVYCRDYTS